MNFNVIIPTYKPSTKLINLVDVLNKQTIKPNKIVIIDTVSDDRTVDRINTENIIIEKINKNDYNHGTTRDYYAKKYINDYLVFMTQDALPYDDKLFENLLSQFSEDDDISLVFARQIAFDDAKPYEKLIRSYNYPNESQIKTKNDVERYGIKTYFCSNVCAAYRMKDYLTIGGFEHSITINEDMFVAYKYINQNKKIVYNSKAIVYHSHSMTLKEQYERSLKQGYEIKKHIKETTNISIRKEGIKLTSYVIINLIKEKHIINVVYFLIENTVKYLGYRKGMKSINSVKRFK